MRRQLFVGAPPVTLAALLLAGAACGREGARESRPGPRPYVVVAVDNHFHDIHPEDHKRVRADRALVIRNDGRNLHNVTVPGTDVDVDLDPGESLSWEPIGDVLAPGTYQVVCRYHDWDGMVGEVTVTP